MSTNTFISFPSPAKLNLFLHIVGQRTDGYHELETVFQFLDVGDTIEIATLMSSSSITLLTPIANVNNEDNLIIKAAKALQQYSNTTKGVQIKINKILPMGGGLGGGSSNAATVLIALNYLWQLQLSLDELANIGISLGADVPVFIHGYAAFAQGIGEKLTPVNPKEDYYLITKPMVSISTQSVFTAPSLTRDTPKIKLDQMDIENCHNDCQTFVIKHYPEVANLLAWLIEYAPSQMTGTGACIFSRFSSKEEAEKVQRLLPENISSFVAKGVNHSPLHQKIAMLKTG
ncbi:4-(cytidine 5'-diphospho)-2-C-methyl-D-erythritol kinase [Thalassotalea sp. 1_MG-2023]|uniref:4-(cytidine 5'-diphospho)-2-C-methyl-D-erythritol kinase n=1 Tax=Thalassotalea sp. 1_MG-2023 TaxID=3062680 RepID=UPI0026E16C62|nr:4-(cytidine 5'-diphospho)-2-C-methyl-D-erythritol kinase [Thalassotalea sp. 1_MG-2023]MDO6427959.1 4-(cytidine 5'-diphospho)-2-C-methyl-D-erythritol kinase [Thalassotalea sp. 1_MG-2023]